MPAIDTEIDNKIGEVRTDAFDLSWGELIGLHDSNEFVVSPDFQRLFRWSPEQRSRLIESILLELPIPQIFVIETEKGILELVDGLQRVCSVIEFVHPGTLLESHGDSDSDELVGCDLIPSLNGYDFERLPLRLRLRLKRGKVRCVVIKRQSTPILRYEMFKRLNTGGSELSEQEIRNCTSRMVGKKGAQFYDFLVECASHPSFVECTESLPDSLREKRGDEELVLRFFSLKIGRQKFKGNVRDWLDTVMEDVILEKRAFAYRTERKDFQRLFDYLGAVLGAAAFVRHREGKPIGGLAPAHFEAVSLGVWNSLDQVDGSPNEAVRLRIVETIESNEFKKYVGPGSNSQAKFNGRIKAVEDALLRPLP